MSLSNFGWQHYFHVLQTSAQVCPPEDLFRTNPGVKLTQVRSVKKPDITDL